MIRQDLPWIGPGGAGTSCPNPPVAVSYGDGKAAISTKSAYGDELLADGSLSETKNFEDVVEAGR